MLVGSKILLTTRGSDVIAYPNTISGISGFVDELGLSLADIVKKELVEEVAAPLDSMSKLVIGEEIIQIDSTLNREWHVYPALAVFENIFEPTINWENKSADWHELDELRHMQLMPGFQEVVDAALALKNT